MPADEMADQLGITLPTRDYATVAGLVINDLHRLPETGEAVETLGWRFEVVDMDGRRIDKVLATRWARAFASFVDPRKGGGPSVSDLNWVYPNRNGSSPRRTRTASESANHPERTRILITYLAKVVLLMTPFLCWALWTDWFEYTVSGFPSLWICDSWWVGLRGATMLTRMTDEDWATVLEVFRACRSRRGAKGRDDRKFLEPLHYFSVHNITWRALPEAFGNWNSVWKRFWRLGQAGVFEAFFDALAASSRSC